MKQLINIARNKYIIATIAFIVWMLFFDRNDITSQYKYQSQLKNLKDEKEFYIRETAIVKKDLEELTSNLTRLQKFAREKYLMKKDNEDIFIIENSKPSE
ncbi:MULTISPECIES: FtsB family cell division protein [Olivibacter]|jgi:cell division protein FtsB|nr:MULTISPECIES: septum formation initiator [Olivibacter]MCL4641785.1 septum formation initiator family protein [Olivibacter sp. UJ_SKK_5.1]MDM8174169.1 septum formation initiator family protein [Olivibacter sp. 47]MDX3917297.1 septum formation initiator family protein [Pseudosphingobacterium sp.]